jgi:hypothetical protein
MFRHHLCHLQEAYMCLMSYLYLLSVVDKILHDGLRWVSKSDVVMCSSLVRNAAAWSWHGTGAAWVRHECGMGAAWVRHGMCESNMAALCKSNGKDTI